MKRFRYSHLLAALLLLILSVALSSALGRRPMADVVVSVTFLVLLVAGAMAATDPGIQRQAVMCLAGVTVLLRIWLEFSTSAVLEAATYTAVIVILFVVAVLTTRHLLASQRVTRDTLAASLCAYGFLAVAWAATYSLLEILQPGSFAYSEISGLQREMRFGLGESATALYFSFITITTLGYGDVIPATDASRLLAATEAFLGQAYIAILVAKLVGQHVVTVSAPAAGD